MKPKAFEIKFEDVDRNKVRIVSIKNVPYWEELPSNMMDDYSNGWNAYTTTGNDVLLWEDSFHRSDILEVGMIYDKSYLADFLDKLKLAETRLFECWGDQSKCKDSKKGEIQ